MLEEKQDPEKVERKRSANVASLHLSAKRSMTPIRQPGIPEAPAAEIATVPTTDWPQKKLLKGFEKHSSDTVILLPTTFMTVRSATSPK